MKKVIKKNQIIVTVLAIMIAVAGYLNYTDSKVDKEAQEANAETTYSDADTYYDLDDLLTSSDDIESLDGEEESDESKDTDMGDTEDAAVSPNDTGEDVTDVDSTDDISDSQADSSDGEGDETPGTAVLTSVSTDNTFVLEAKINREQTRSKNKESLLEVINSENISDDLKTDAVSAMVKLTETTELENTIETLLEAKGFEDVIVTISDDSVDVILDMTDISDDRRAQIEEVVKRKTELSADSIVITPLS